MSRRHCIFENENADLETNLTIRVTLYSTLNQNLINTKRGLCSTPKSGISAQSANGIQGIGLTTANTARPYWFNTTSTTQASIQSIYPKDRTCTLAFYICMKGGRGHGWCFDLIDRNAANINGAAMATSHYGNANNFKPYWISNADIAPPTANIWTHVAIVYDRDTMKTYYNGMVKDERDKDGASSVQGFGIALRAGSADGSNNSPAIFRQICFYNNRALTDSEIQALFFKEQRLLVGEYE